MEKYAKELRMCKNCGFYQALSGPTDGKFIGLCRRHAPRPFIRPEDEYWIERIADWPPVYENDYCGEWGPQDGN